MKKFWWFGWAFFFAGAASGAVFLPKGRPALDIEKVSIYPKAELLVNDKPDKKPVELTLTGAGVRAKKIVLVNIKAYVLASYVDDPGAVEKDKSLDGVLKSRNRAVHMTFLRDIDAAKIKSSYQDALKENGADLNSEPLKKVFSEITDGVKKSESLTIVTTNQKGETDSLIFQFPRKTFAVDGKGLGDTFWKIWFGKPADSGLKALKSALFQPIVLPKR